MVRRSASSAPRFSGAERTRSSVTSALRLPSSSAAFCTTSSSGRSETRLSTPSTEVATLDEVGRHARDHRVRLRRRGRAPRAARPAPRRARPAATGRAGRLVASRARSPSATCVSSASSVAAAGSARVVRDADPARGDREGGAQRHLRLAGVVDDRGLQRLDLADLQAAEADRARPAAARRPSPRTACRRAAARRARRRRSSAAPRSRSDRGRRRGRPRPGRCSSRRCRRRRRPAAARSGCRR